MPIKSGIGFGEAQVYNQPGAIVNLYGKLLQQQAKDQAQFATDLNNIMSKYSTKGLKDEDIKLTANAYQQIKDKVTSSSTRNPAERAQALADARNGMQTIQEYSDSALNAYKTLDQLAPDVALNPWKYQDGTKEVVEQLYKNPYAKWGDNYKALNQTTFQRQPDNSSVYKLLNDVNSDLSKIAPVTGKATDSVTGKHITTYYNVPQEQALNNLYTAMELNPQAKYTLTNLYQQANPDKTDFTPAEVADFGLQLYAKQYGDNAFKFYGGRNKITKEAGDDASNPANFEVIYNKTFNTDEVRKDGKIIPGKEAITFDKFVTTPVIQPFATPQIGNAFNISEGKPESIGSKKGLRITGIGTKNGNIRVTVVDDSETEYYLKPDDVPMSIRNGKQYKTAIKALGGSSSKGGGLDYRNK